MQFPLARLTLTVFIVALAMGLNFVWESVESPVTGEAAVLQLDDSTAGYALAKRAAQHIPQKAITYSAGALVLLLWVPWLFRFGQRSRNQEDPEQENPTAT